MPGPVLFGFVLDKSCLLWDRNCDNSKGSCLYYDNHRMGWSMLAVCCLCKIANAVFGLIACRLYRPSKDPAVAKSQVKPDETTDSSVVGEVKATPRTEIKLENIGGNDFDDHSEQVNGGLDNAAFAGDQDHRSVANLVTA